MKLAPKKSLVQLESYALEDFISSSRNLVSFLVIPHLEHASVMGNALHDHPLYFVCSDFLRVVGEISDGIQVGFIGPDGVLSIFLSIYLFMYLFIYLYLRCKFYSCLFNQIKITF